MTLIDILSKLDGPSGALDREICKHLGLLSSMTCEYNHWPLRVTSSVDDAIALAERVLPGCDLTIRSREKMAWIDGCKGQIAYGATPAIAACIAILRAKEASHGE